MKFQTRVGDFDELCAHLRAVAQSSTIFWEQNNRISISMRIIWPATTLQIYECQRESPFPSGLFHQKLGVRESALMGRINRFYGAQFVPEPRKKSDRKMNYFSDEYAQRNPYFNLEVVAPSMHEKMESLCLVREWVMEHWPEGKKHLARVV